MTDVLDELLGFEDYVNRYLNALAKIPDNTPNALHPRMHLLGHAVELSLREAMAKCAQGFVKQALDRVKA